MQPKYQLVGESTLCRINFKEIFRKPSVQIIQSHVEMNTLCPELNSNNVTRKTYSVYGK